jgi:hypothetical protein
MLIELKTDLKSLKFGKDRPGGGSSNQPYIQKPIPDGEQPGILSTGGPDVLVRGGLLAPIRAAEDTSRLAKMFADLKSPNGILFTTKLNVLSRTSVKTEASLGAAYAGGGVNQGLYLPTSTLAQAAAGFTGTHLNLLGIDPTSPMAGVAQGGLSNLLGVNLGLNRYYDVVKALNSDDDRVLRNNRLILLSRSKIYNKLDESNPLYELNEPPATSKGISSNPNGILSYGGGPGSVLGIGKTDISFTSNPTPNSTKRTSEKADYINKKSNIDYSRAISTNGVSNLYINLTKQEIDLNLTDKYFFNVYDPNITPGNTWPQNTPLQKSNNSITFTQQQIIDNGSKGNSNIKEDFRKLLIQENNITGSSSVLSLSPNYTKHNMSIRVHAGDPGKTNNKDNTKDIFNYSLPANESYAVDKINAQLMYKNNWVDTNYAVNDLVKFRIASIINGTNEAWYMHFRAFINSFDDSYSATWNSVNYVGRGDTLYNYGGFTRDISLSFTVAAQSKAELIPMFRKLNFLASTLTPDYSTNVGYMRGNISRITIGGYIYEQPGIITSLSYTVPNESPWEIAIGVPDSSDVLGNDESVKELPHVIDVNMSFIPIHNFLPSKPNVDPNYSDKRYISLANKGNTSLYSEDNEYSRYRFYDKNNIDTTIPGA